MLALGCRFEPTRRLRTVLSNRLVLGARDAVAALVVVLLLALADALQVEANLRHAVTGFCGVGTNSSLALVDVDLHRLLELVITRHHLHALGRVVRTLIAERHRCFAFPPLRLLHLRAQLFCPCVRPTLSTIHSLHTLCGIVLAAFCDRRFLAAEDLLLDRPNEQEVARVCPVESKAMLVGSSCHGLHDLRHASRSNMSMLLDGVGARASSGMGENKLPPGAHRVEWVPPTGGGGSEETSGASRGGSRASSASLKRRGNNFGPTRKLSLWAKNAAHTAVCTRPHPKPKTHISLHCNNSSHHRSIHSLCSHLLLRGLLVHHLMRRHVPRGGEEVVAEPVEVHLRCGIAVAAQHERHDGALGATADGARHV